MIDQKTTDANQGLIVRLRREKSDREEAKRIADEEQRILDEKERAEGMRAGRDWATGEASLDQLENLARANLKPENPRRHLIVEGFCPTGSSNFREGYIAGILAVWHEVKDRL